MGRAISDAARLECIFERRVGGNSLGRDPKRARSDQGEVALPEIATGACVVDRCGRTAVADHLLAAIGAAVLELRQGQRIGYAQPHRSAPVPLDLPQAALRLRQRLRARGSGECNGGQGRDYADKTQITLHLPLLSTILLCGN